MGQTLDLRVPHSRGFAAAGRRRGCVAIRKTLLPRAAGSVYSHDARASFLILSILVLVITR